MNSGAATACAPSLQQAEESLRTGAFECAVEQFTACVQENPHAVAAHRGRAIAQFQLKQWSAATEDFRRARQCDATDLESWLGLGLSLAMTHAAQEAVNLLEELASAHPAFIRGRIRLAQLYYRLCITAKGRAHLERALTLRPTLEERREIEQILREQRALDARRYYRPDFEALRRRQQGRSSLWAVVRNRLWKSVRHFSKRLTLFTG